MSNKESRILKLRVNTSLVIQNSLFIIRDSISLQFFLERRSLKMFMNDDPAIAFAQRGSNQMSPSLLIQTGNPFMLQFFRDKFSTAQLKARYEHLVHQRLVELTEAAPPQPISEDPGEWTLLGGTKNIESEHERTSVRDQVRKLVRENPHACNVLRMLESYITGPGMSLSHQRLDCQERTADDDELIDSANRLWKSFQQANHTHYSFSEHARRTWRDGECFVRKFESSEWPPSVRYVDPETITETPETTGSQGILTEPHDVETPVAYLQSLSNVSTSRQQRAVERVPADEMLQTRIGVDSNEKRGVSLFAPIVEPLNSYTKWMETELLARKLQSSIVLWRKVQGSPQAAETFAEQSGSASSSLSGIRRERFAPGTVLTTNHGTDIQFLQPNTNFGDAVSLGRMILLSIAAGAGLPEFMLTADASNANFSSTMVAEGPAVKFFQSQQQFFADEFTRLWRWIMQEAIDMGLLPEDFFERISINWSFPHLVNRDRPKERMADVQLVEKGVLSRAEVARRDGVDPTLMQTERKQEWSLESPEKNPTQG